MTAGGDQVERLPRSLLFVPASDERKLGKALASEADLLILRRARERQRVSRRSCGKARKAETLCPRQRL
jgi:hypothetical protein